MSIKVIKLCGQKWYHYTEWIYGLSYVSNSVQEIGLYSFCLVLF